MGTARTYVLDLAGRLAARAEDYCLVTVVRTADATSAKAGAKAVVARDGTLTGFVGGGCVTGAARRAALEALSTGAPRLIRVRPKDQVIAAVDVDGVELHASSCPSRGTVELFLEPVRRPSRLVVAGASPIAAALVTLGRALGRHVVTAALAEDQAKLPAADTALSGFDLAPLGLDGRDAVVVATQGRRDREALAAALLSDSGYVGMVGSRRKVAMLTAQIADRVPADRLARLHGPAGLDLGAIEPEEIALSILAEIVRERRVGVALPKAAAAE
jgi:xanthine dehydrogenase accessory factor